MDKVVDTYEALPLSEVSALLDLIDSVAFTNGVKAIPTRVWQLSDKELEERAAPTKAVYALREALWRAIRRSLSDGQKIKLTNLVQGVCTYTHAYEAIIRRPERLAWLLRPIHSFYDEGNARLLGYELLEKMREIIRLPIVDHKGRPNTRNANLVFRAWTLVAEHLGPTKQSYGPGDPSETHDAISHK